MISQLIPNLYQSGWPQAGSVKNFDVVVLLACMDGIEPDIFPVFGYPGQVVIKWEIDDGPVLPDLQTLRILAFTVVRFLQRNQKIIVLCHAGLNRSSLMTAMVMHLMHGWTGAEIIRVLRERRDPYCLCNPMFEKYVRSWGEDSAEPIVEPHAFVLGPFNDCKVCGFKALHKNHQEELPFEEQR